jgi:hypothetical protein
MCTATCTAAQLRPPPTQSSLHARRRCCSPQVEYADGRSTLVLMPARFNKKLWVRRGGYVIIDESEEAQQDAGSRSGVGAGATALGSRAGPAPHAWPRGGDSPLLVCGGRARIAPLDVEGGSALRLPHGAPISNGHVRPLTLMLPRVTGTIVSVLYDEHVRQLRRTPGAW